MHFRAVAGGLKNPASERKVPLHPHVIEAGFIEFVGRSGRGPLFYDPKRRRPEAKKPQPKIVAKNVALKADLDRALARLLAEHMTVV